MELSAEDCRNLVLELSREELERVLCRYIEEHRQEVRAAVENLWNKYGVSLRAIQTERDVAAVSVGWVFEGVGVCLTYRKIAIFSDLFALKYGHSLPESDRREGQIPVYGSNGVVGLHDRSVCCGPKELLLAAKALLVNFHGLKKIFGRLIQLICVNPRENVELRMGVSGKLLSLNLSKLNSSTGVPGLNRNDVLMGYQLLFLLKLNNEGLLLFSTPWMKAFGKPRP